MTVRLTSMLCASALALSIGAFGDASAQTPFEARSHAFTVANAHSTRASCGVACEVKIGVMADRYVQAGDGVFVELEIANRGPVSPPMPLGLTLGKDNPSIQLRVHDAAGGTVVSEGGWRFRADQMTRHGDETVYLLPGEGRTFHVRLPKDIPAGAARVEVLFDGRVIATFNPLFNEPPRSAPPVSPPPPAPTPPPADDGVVLTPDVALTFKGIWFTGEYYIRIMDAPGGRTKAVAFDSEGQEAGAFRIEANRSTSGQLVGRLPNASEGEISLYPDGANGLLMIARGGGYDGSRAFRGSRVSEIGRARPGMTEIGIAALLTGRWTTPFGVLTLSMQNDRLIGVIPGTATEQALRFDALVSQDAPVNQSLRFNWGQGQSTETDQRVTLTPSADGSGFAATSVSHRLRGQVEWRGSRLAVETPQPTPPDPDPTPPVVQPTPPVVQPSPPVVEPTPPVVEPSPPPPQPTPPVVQPTPPVVEPTPPVVQPGPPAPQPTPPAIPQPQPPRPQPPTPAPPAAGGSSVGAQGGYQGISQTWDVKFDGARVERDSEIHVFISIKNRSTSDQYVTPGTFIPNLGNQDGEMITSRAVFRASGDTPTEFRPTVPVNGEVRVRFIFRPDAGTAQPRTFTLESFGHRKLTFDVSSLRVGSLAQ